MANFLGMYIKDLAKMLAPIYNLTPKGVKFEWTEECQKSFEAVKQAMSEAPVLVLPNRTRLFQLQSDTSKTGCRGALFQVQDGEPRLLGYYSKKLPPVCARYGITELEMTGMTAVIMAFHHLLSHMYFQVYVDHSAIMYIMKAKDEPHTDRIARLLEILQKYSFVVKYQKGQDMWIADFLSRAAQEPETDGIIPISFDAARSLIAPMETRSMRRAREQDEQATPPAPAATASPETQNQNPAGQSKQTEHLGLEPERLAIDTLPPPREATMLWPTTPVVQRPTADPKMQQIAEMLWERLKQDPTFEALEVQECTSEEVYPPEVEMDFRGYLPSNQTMDRVANMNLPEDLGAREEKPLYMTLPTNVRKGGVVLSQYPQQKDLNKLLRRMSQTALHDVHLPIGAHELIAEYSRSPFKGIYQYLTTQQTGL